MVSLQLVGSRKVREVLSNHADYTLYIRKGFAFKGAKESIDDKQPKPELVRNGFNLVWKTLSFEERMNRMYEHYVAFDIDIDNEKNELHLNAFSESDMY
jgi:hypothetical protein